MYVQWDTVDLFPPPPPERKADRRLVQVHKTNSRAFSLKDIGTPFAYHRLWACEVMEAGFPLLLSILRGPD